MVLIEQTNVLNKFATLSYGIFMLFILNSSYSEAKTTNDLNASSEVTYSPVHYIEDSGVPWGMDWLINEDLIVSYRRGQLKRYRKGQYIGEITGLPEIAVGNQGGLLDIKVYSDKANKQWLYFAYSKPQLNGYKSTAIMRAQLQGNKLVDKQLIYESEAKSRKGVHFGSRIAFDKQGFLYFSVGDRGQRDVNPQDIFRDGGKTYRLNADGSIPKSNPFYHIDGAKKASFTIGHRNPQGMFMHPESGKIWIHEHGPKGGDEVNLLSSGKNYGWPVVSYGTNYNGTRFTELTHKAGMEQPLWHWTPSIAPSGFEYINSSKYPMWQNKLVAGSLKFGYLVFLTTQGESVVAQQIAFEGLKRIRNVRQGPDGYLYLAVDKRGIFRIMPVQ